MPFSQRRLPGVPETFGGPGNSIFIILAGAPLAVLCITAAVFLLAALDVDIRRAEWLVLPGLGASATMGIGLAWYLLRWLRAHRVPLVFGCLGLAIGLPITMFGVTLIITSLGWLTLPLAILAAAAIAWRTAFRPRPMLTASPSNDEEKGRDAD